MGLAISHGGTSVMSIPLYRVYVCVHYSSLISGLNCLFASGVDARDCKTDQNSITGGIAPVIYGAS